MRRRPWIPASLLLVMLGLWGLIGGSEGLDKGAGCLAIAGGVIFLVSGEWSSRRR